MVDGFCNIQCRRRAMARRSPTTSCRFPLCLEGYISLASIYTAEQNLSLGCTHKVYGTCDVMSYQAHRYQESTVSMHQLAPYITRYSERTMQMLFPFNSVCASFVFLRPLTVTSLHRYPAVSTSVPCSRDLARTIQSRPPRPYLHPVANRVAQMSVTS